MNTNPWTFCVAPMMGWTDRHFRYLFRLMSKHARLYTVMITSNALIHADPAHFLDFDAAEHPVALQLGGNNPKELAFCAKLAEQWGYAEVNLNVGCPSDRVKSGQFGACLMAHPQIVSDCVAAMKEAVNHIPITVKIRLGVDDLDSEPYFNQFVDTVSQAGCEVFLVHARKAWLNGLSPKQNRTVPPLKYDWVYRLKERRPDLTVVINGGIHTIEESKTHLQQVDGVMIGRAAYENPYQFSTLDQVLFESTDMPLSRIEWVRAYLPYIQRQVEAGVSLKDMSRHLLPLFNSQSGARGWRRFLSNYAHKQGAGAQVVEHALGLLAG